MRQWPIRWNDAREDHRIRYEFAGKIARGRTLDAACGVGYGSRFLQSKVPEVVGVDISPDAIDWAHKYFPGPTYIIGDIEQEPWEGKFETIVSFETLEHLKAPDKALQAFRRACVGLLVASVPNEDNFHFDEKKFAGDEYPHQRHYTPDQFASLLTDNGFTVTHRMCQKSKQDANLIDGTDGMFMVYVCT